MKWYEGMRFDFRVSFKVLKIGVEEPDGTVKEVDMPIGMEMINLDSDEGEKIGAVKIVNELGLDPRFDLRRHSPAGFEWGYGGSGPSQLALALLADATGNDALACELYQHYKEQVVCKWKVNRVLTTDVEILRWVCKQRLCRDRSAKNEV